MTKTQNKGLFWWRFAARLCDYCLLFLVLGIASLFLPIFYDPFFYFFMALCIPFLWVPLEAFAISRFGKTLGKWLFGLSVQMPSNARLSYVQALKRSFFLPARPGLVIKKPISKLRTALALLATLGSLCFGWFGNQLTQWSTGIPQGVVAEGWVQFESDKADFKIYFPSDPEAQSKELIMPNTGKVLQYEEITSHEEAEVDYSVTHMNIPNKWRLAGNATLLKLSLEGIVKHSPEAKLLSKQFIIHQGHRALDYTLHQGETQVRGRLLVIGNTMYKLNIVYPKGDVCPVESKPFLDSFASNP